MDDQPAVTPKILFSDTHLRLTEALGVYTLEYLHGDQTEFRETFDCKLCAIKSLWRALAYLAGGICQCKTPLRTESEDVIREHAGGPN